MLRRKLNARQQILKKWLRPFIVAAIAFGLLIYSGYGLLDRYRATHKNQPLPAGGATAAVSTERPDETIIDPKSSYVVDAHQPRLINLPSLGKSGFIQKVSLDQRNAIAVPANINMAGWYAPGPAPGASGVSVIVGHVQGKNRPGIFKNLATLQIGDEFWVEFGDGTKRTFEVKDINSYGISEVAEKMFSQVQGIGEQLNLITCDGSYNSESHQYDQRLLVVAKRMK